jgi:protein-S-isoprenylcysteine O-methyltransferase Ste14
MVPEFQLGLWNAWILMLYVPLQGIIMTLIDKAVGTGDIIKKMGDVPYEPREKRANTIAMIILAVMVIYSIFLPLKIGTAWLIIGLLIYFFGLILFIVAIVNVAKTPLGQPFVNGIYHYSRHPLYFFSFITYLGTSFATLSWVFLLLSVMYFGLLIFFVNLEEQACLELYGDPYQKYLDRTPRWLGIPKSS